VWRPPATQGDLEVLNNRARAIMFSLSQTLIEAEAALKQPPTYPSQAPSEDFDPDIYGPRTTRPDGRSRPSVAVGNRNLGSPLPTAQPPSDRPTASYPQTRQLTKATPTGATKTTLPAPAPGHFQPTPGTQIRTDIDDSRTRTPRALSAGEVIGAARGATDPLDARRPPSRVNPIGGVIGETPALLPPGMLAANRPSDSPTGAGHRRRHTSEDLWDVAEGVPPILQPLQSPARTDPGPAIGLSL
jgi:hypothetical protein